MVDRFIGIYVFVFLLSMQISLPLILIWEDFKTAVILSWSSFLACISTTFWIFVFLLPSRLHFEMQVCTMKPGTAKRSVPEKFKSRITNFLVFLLASISHFELHVYTKQPQGAERLVPEKYKSQSSNLHPRVLRFKMCWYITTFKPCFSFPLVFIDCCSASCR